MSNKQLPNLTPFLDMITEHILSVFREQETPVLFITGEVISVQPLQIKISPKVTLTESELLLSATVKETWINIPTTPVELIPMDDIYEHRHIVPQHFTEQGGQQDPHIHEVKPFYTEFALPKIKLWRGLAIGDVVRLLKVQEGQFYFVLEREETITNDIGGVEDGTD